MPQYRLEAAYAHNGKRVLRVMQEGVRRAAAGGTPLPPSEPHDETEDLLDDLRFLLHQVAGLGPGLGRQSGLSGASECTRRQCNSESSGNIFLQLFQSAGVYRTLGVCVCMCVIWAGYDFAFHLVIV